MAEVEYTVWFPVGATTVGHVKFDPTGMTREEILDRIEVEAETETSLCHQCGRHLSLGDPGDAVGILADGKPYWDASMGRPGPPGLPQRLLWASDIGAFFGVTANTVNVWAGRYKDTPTPIPAPDFVVGASGDSDVPPRMLWRPEREPEWREWEKGRRATGRGAGGGRPYPKASDDDAG